MGGSIGKNSREPFRPVVNREIMPRNYKQLTQHKKDASNSSGGWNKIAYFQKDTPNTSGTGYIDRVTVNFLVDDISGSDAIRSSFPFGHLFCLSNADSTETVDSESGMLDPADMLDVGGRDGGAGSITLYARRKIAGNDVDTVEGDGNLYLWQKNTDLTASDDVIMRYYIETYGRWVVCKDA